MLLRAWMAAASEPAPSRTWRYPRALRAARVLARRARGDVAGAARAHGDGGSGPRLAPLAGLRAALDRIDAPLLSCSTTSRRSARATSLADVESLLERPHPSLRLVLATRSDPPVRLQRLRVAGDWSRSAPRTSRSRRTRRASSSPLELGAGRRGDAVEPHRGLGRGAPAGRAVAAAHPDPSAFIAGFAGDDRAVSDYLTSEVLNGYDEDEAAGSCSGRRSSSG